ncbi:hemicentin-1-like isoform X3 [Siniperca chuatsi]|uniref:hemicentin-1-like isoform X3 n=1 Tax=Siniperca chuatsi TaxID=119488 RepID=UPI001CE151B5|nr:hemicentin-1-like isoform X3 [Siniperca chuatsi]
MFNLQVTSTTMELLPLVCLCLLTRSGTTFAEEGSKVIKVNRGSDVTLPCSLSTKENIEDKLFVWKKDGQKELFLYEAGDHYNNVRTGQVHQFEGRVSHFPDRLKLGDASINIRKTKLADSGNYTCAFPRLQPSQIFHIQLVVVAAATLSIEIFETKDGTLLQCEIQGATPQPKLHWQDIAGNILPAGEPQASERGGIYNITLQTTVTKTGLYVCSSTQEEINRQISVVTYMYITGAAPEPSVTILDQTKDWSLLQCEVQGAPKPKVEWQDSAGNILPAEEPQVSERGSRYNIILQTNVTKTDRYRCVATQEDINHQIYTETYVFISGSKVIRVEVGSDVTLPCSLSTKENITDNLFDWRKDDQKEVFLYDAGDHYNNGRAGQDEQFEGRVSHFPDELKLGDASIKIRNTSVTDSGDYTCAFPRLQPNQTFHIRLLVVDPILKDRSGENIPGSKVIRVEEDSDVTLPCSLSTKEDIELKLFDWKKDGQKEVFLYDAGDHYNNGRAGQDEQFKGRVSHFPDELKHGDASIKIRNTRVADSGDYTCDFPRLQPSQIFHIRLVVGSKVIRVEEDSDVTLPCSLSSKEDIEFKLFDWKKDGHKEVFLYEAGDHYNNGRAGQDQQFKGRVSHFPDRLEHGDASIKIRNTRVTDSGVYTCAFPRLQPSQIFHIQLVVGSKVIRVEEDSDVTLPCSLSTKEDIELKRFDWRKDGHKEVFLYDAGLHSSSGQIGQDQQFDGRVSHFQDRLQHGDASIKIRKTKLADSGNYTCDFPRLQPSQIFHIQLVVVGAAAKLSIEIFETKVGMMLQCKVQGASPQPKLQWQDSAGNNLSAEEPQVSERGSRYNIILQTTVTKTDRYRCVATQEDINHQIYTETYVFISGSSTGWIAFGVLLVVGVVGVLLYVLYKKGYFKLNSQKGSPQETSFP